MNSLVAATPRQLPSPVADLLDEHSASEILRQAGLSFARAVPGYLRHKPGETSIVSYLFDVEGSAAPGLGYAQWCERIDRADEIHHKALSLRPQPSSVGVSTIRVDDHTVFYGFPNDPRLRRLRWYTTPRKLKRVLASLAPTGHRISGSRSSSLVLKYKPERRVVAHVELVTVQGSRQDLLLRYTSGRHAGQLAATAEALLANSVNTPAPLAQLDDGRVGVDEFIEGSELRTWVRQGGSVADQLAADLRTFHLTGPPRGTRVRHAVDDLANALAGLRSLCLWDPELAVLARDVAARLTPAQPATEARGALIHGDLHDKNVLVNNDQVWFIDLERAAVGSPASDLGRLLAHAISLEIRQPGWSPGSLAHAEAVIEAYRRLPGAAKIDERTLAWFCAIALVDQALLVTRHVEAGWATSARALLATAIDQLARSTTSSTRSRRTSTRANPS